MSAEKQNLIMELFREENKANPLVQRRSQMRVIKEALNKLHKPHFVPFCNSAKAESDRASWKYPQSDHLVQQTPEQ